ncbi:MAG: oxygen-independent coproporphyrinogen III oxidase [Betaproteobacteria bacterium]|nr:oxygen-independent coproporphyrinogen III oxidase [Betaproteobacteria bacterium]
MPTATVTELRQTRPGNSIQVDTDLVKKYDRPGPRYTSYPTADRFIEAYDARAHGTTLAQRSVAWGPAANTQPLSLYIHIPFCNTICYYCGCNKVVTKDHGRSAKYLRYLEREFALVSGLVKGNRRAEQVHLGGGTPTFLSIEELQTMMRQLGNHFELSIGEYAVEIDPRTVDNEKTAALAQLGFNRMSLGVQDFDPEVQKAVNRIQSEEVTASAIDTARRHGVTSINLDLIYGLPKQSVASFDRTLTQVLALKPDRIALYSYAHLPAMFKPQRRIEACDLPSAEEKLQIMTLAITRLTDAGYVYIGMDHFALPHDELSIAAKSARLHRNFQGYSTRPDSDLIAFGISAISKIGATYSQNVKTLDEYYDRLDRGELPVLRGIELTADDLLRRAVIQSLMCHFELSIESIEIAHLVKFQEYFADEWARLEELAAEGLVTLEPGWINVTPKGRLLVRTIAMIFDRYLARGEQRERFSKVI